MKTVTRMAAQGELMFLRVESLPEDATLVDPDPQGVIVGHSETGHHHRAFPVDPIGAPFQVYRRAADPLKLWILGEAEIHHQREFDTHEPFRLGGGEGGGKVIWEVRRQVEHTPEGWWAVAD